MQFEFDFLDKIWFSRTRNRISDDVLETDIIIEDIIVILIVVDWKVKDSYS